MFFKTQTNQKVINFKTNTVWSFGALSDESALSDKDIERIKDICNEELVYRWLFEEKMKGEVYSLEKAKGFVSWAVNGWKEQKYFVFIVRDEKGEIQAALDIKSDNLNGALIGYWASVDGAGIMTNAVKILCEIAEKNGYRKLVAEVRSGNDKSLGVLTRVGFEKEGETMDDGILRMVFSKKLNNNT